jgi:hypothetical protein
MFEPWLFAPYSHSPNQYKTYILCFIKTKFILWLLHTKIWLIYKNRSNAQTYDFARAFLWLLHTKI